MKLTLIFIIHHRYHPGRPEGPFNISESGRDEHQAALAADGDVAEPPADVFDAFTDAARSFQRGRHSATVNRRRIKRVLVIL